MTLSTLDTLDVHAFDEMMRVNVRGTFVVDEQALRRVRDGGAIINFSSSVVQRSVPTYAGYSASQAAIDAIALIRARTGGSRRHRQQSGPGSDRDADVSRGKGTGSHRRDWRRIGSRSPRHTRRHCRSRLVPGRTSGRWINAQVLYADGRLR
jgi:3-oxoacyl-[acyl-carrier protein] reductase